MVDGYRYGCEHSDTSPYASTVFTGRVQSESGLPVASDSRDIPFGLGAQHTRQNHAIVVVAESKSTCVVGYSASLVALSCFFRFGVFFWERWVLGVQQIRVVTPPLLWV